MSNSDDGFPSSGGSDRTDQTPDGDASQSDSRLRAPSPLGGGDSIVDDIDLDDVDFDSIFGSPEDKPKKPNLPKVPRLPPPLAKTPDRPQPPAIPKKDPPAVPQQRRQAKTLMGLSFGSDEDEPGQGLSAIGSDSDFEGEKTEIASGFFDDDSDAQDAAKGGLFTQSSGLGELGDAIDEISEVELVEEGDDADEIHSFDEFEDDDFDAEKTNVAESPLEFPEDERESSGPVVPTNKGLPPVDLVDDDKTEIGISIDMPDVTGPSDSFDEPAPAAPAPPPEAQNFGFSNFDPAQHAADSQALPTPIGVPQGMDPAPGDPGSGQDGFEGEKTELLDSPFSNDPLTAKIHALEGPAAGQEFFVNNIRNTIGRGTNNTIVVPDVAMSRQHMEIVNNGDGTYTLRDLQSVNGTALNGTRIREGDIFHGDRFEAGKTVFQFVLSGANIPAPTNRRVIPAALQTGPQPSAQPSAEFRPPMSAPAAQGSDSGGIMTKIAIVAAIFSILLIGGVGFLVWQKKSKASDSEQPTVESTTTPTGLYLEGVEAVKSREWDQAERSFKQARALDPELANVDAQLERIARERGFARLIEDARKLLDDGKRSAAVERVADIPRESVYYEDGQALLRENKKLTVDELYTQAMAAFGRDDLELAEQRIVEIREIVPEHEGASRLEERIATAKETTEEVAEVEAKEGSSTTRRKRVKRKRQDDDWGFGIEPSGSGGSSGSSKIVNFTKGYSLYRSKKFGKAIAFFDDAAKDSDGTWAKRAERTSSEIKKFKASYDAGNRAYSSKDWRRAEKQLIAARRFDTAVAQNGFFGDELSKKIADTKAEIGKSELKAGDYDSAYKYAREARNYDGSSRALRELNSQLERKAKALYVQAVNKGKTDPAQAAKLCRTIMSMTDSGDQTHKKAKQLLKDL